MADKYADISDSFDDPRKLLRLVESGTDPTTGEAVYSVSSSVYSSALPNGAATAAKQDDLLTELQLKADLTENQPTIIKGAYNSGGDLVVARIDASTSSLQTVTHEHHEIHSGSHYFVRGVQDLSINNVLGFTWVMPNTTAWVHLTWSIDTESETAWYFYENAVISSALANTITLYNSNRNSANTSGTTMKYELHANLAAANTKTDVSGATLLSSGISGAGKNSGAAKRENEMILKQNTIYCMRAVATAAGFINFEMNWYEHTAHN